MIERIIVALLTSIGSKLLAWALSFIQAKQQQVATDKDIDNKLATVKEAYKEAIDGEKVTPEQRKKVNQALSDFIRNPGNGGL